MLGLLDLSSVTGALMRGSVKLETYFQEFVGLTLSPSRMEEGARVVGELYLSEFERFFAKR